LVEGLLAGQRQALARALSAVEDATPAAAALLAAVQPHLGRARSIGVTGPPGAGKSTLIAALIGELRRRGLTVGVLAIDPSSPISGGALLGDRLRMDAHLGDPGVFVRSLAARGHPGGLSRSTWAALQVMDAWGPDVILLETVGAGQSDVEVADLAQVRVVLCAPGAGDEVQAIKAGILEIADILVVNKADQAQAAQTASQLRSMLSLRRDAREVPVLCTTASTGQGVPELAELLLAAPPPAPGPAGQRLAPMRRLLADAAARRLRSRLLAADDATLDALCLALARGEIGLDAAAAQVLGAALADPAGPA
jgi:LAO/AO transport system kinase